MSSVLTNASNPRVVESPNRPERRQVRRAGVKVIVRLRPGDANDPKFEEALPTLNASRENLYVISSASKNYYKRMPLRITFPFDPKYDNPSTPEDCAEIVRLDHLDDGRVGIAIKFQRAVHAARQINSSTAGTNGQANQERRFAVRHAISASAKVADIDCGTRLQARCSDLSVTGCYIDTLNPFPQGSRAQLQLAYQGRTFEVNALVITHHVGMGMGLAFDKVGTEQKFILLDWISNRRNKPQLVSESAASEPSVVPGPSDTLDRALFVKLVRLLESNGQPVPEEVSSLLSREVNV